MVHGESTEVNPSRGAAADSGANRGQTSSQNPKHHRGLSLVPLGNTNSPWPHGHGEWGTHLSPGHVPTLLHAWPSVLRVHDELNMCWERPGGLITWAPRAMA